MRFRYSTLFATSLFYPFALASVLFGKEIHSWPSTVSQKIGKNDSSFVNTEPSNVKIPYFQKRGLVVMSPAEKSTGYLKWFVGNLKEYVSPIEFRYNDFLGEMSELKEELDSISHFMKSVDDPEILKQLIFSRSMFEIILKSAKLMKGFTAAGSREEYWMYRLIDLRVRVLSLFNSFGEPDTDNKWLGNRIGVLYTEFATFKSLVGSETEMDPETLMVVQIQIDAIGPMFSKLMNYLPH